MTAHSLTVSSVMGARDSRLEGVCSCGVEVLLDEWTITLDRLAELQHEHINTAERERQVDPVVNPRSVLPPEFYGDEPSPVEHTGPFPVTDGFGRIIGYWHG